MKILKFFALIFISLNCLSQKPFIKDIIIRADKNEYLLSKDKIKTETRTYLPISYRINTEVIELELLLNKHQPIEKITLQESPFFVVLSQPVSVGDEKFVSLIQFKNASKSNFVRVQYNFYFSSGDSTSFDIELFLYSKFEAEIRSFIEEMYVGEEYVFEISTNLPENIIANPKWVDKDFYQYKIVNRENQYFLHITPFASGKMNFNVEFEIYKPILENGEFKYTYTLNTPVFTVKSGRLVYLNIDVKDFILTETSSIKPIEVQIDNNRLLKLGKTYRIENNENIGSTLIAELFPKQALANNKVICDLKLYNYHRTEKGFLYIKDGDFAQFITNFNVFPRTSIKTVKTSIDGKQWIENRSVFPGSTILVRLEGESFHKAEFSFDAIPHRNIDTIAFAENEAEYRLRIPPDFPKNNINILNFQKPTGVSLNIIEYQRPRQFDFLLIDYGKGFKNIDEIKGPEFIDGTLKNIVIRPDNSKIDEIERFYGKQYIDIEVKVFSPRNELVEIMTLKNICFCPDQTSIRFPYYNKSDCRTADISFNQNLSKKTYDWESWSRAIITIKHSNDYYKENIQQKNIEIILQKRVMFDIDVSFPAGLLIIEQKQEKIGTFSGVSMAMVAQFSFYQKEKLARLRPYKIGVGFLALNALNFSANVNRDLSMVLLGSLYPTRRNTKMAFPLYLGAGYFLYKKKFFWLIGPGIRVSF